VTKLLSAQLGSATLSTNTHTVFNGNIQDIKMLLGYQLLISSYNETQQDAQFLRFIW